MCRHRTLQALVPIIPITPPVYRTRRHQRVYSRELPKLLYTMGYETAVVTGWAQGGSATGKYRAHWNTLRGGEGVHGGTTTPEAGISVLIDNITALLSPDLACDTAVVAKVVG